MNKPCLIVILLMWLAAGPMGNVVTAKIKYNSTQLTKQLTQHKFTFKELTAQDRKNYVLTIDRSKIGKPHDTILYKRRCKVLMVSVTLSNLSNDTLRYLSMTCSWDDFFSIDNKNLSVLSWPCQYNTPQYKLILPHKSTTYNVPVLINGNIKGDKLRIGMNLFIMDKQNRNSGLDFPSAGYKTKNLIWSKEAILH